MKFDSSNISSHLQCETNPNVQFYIMTYIKDSFPSNKFYLLIFIIFKFLGILVITNSGIGLNTSYSKNKNYTLGEYLRRLLYFHDIDDDRDQRNYNLICIFIYLIIIVSIALFVFVWKKSDKNYIIEKKKILKNFKSEKFRPFSFRFRLLIYIMCFLLNLIVFFSQHLIEILSLIYIDIFLRNTYGKNIPNNQDGSHSSVANNSNNISISTSLKLNSFINNFEQKIFINNYILCVLNTFFIFFINLITYYFLKYVNDPLISSNSNMQYSSNKLFLILLIIISNFSSIHYLDKIFPSFINIKIILLILCLITIIIFRISFRKFLQKNLFNILLKHFSFFCIFSVILNFIIYSDKTDTNTTTLITLKIEILRIVVLSSLSIIVTHMSFKLNKYKNLKNISKILFHKTKILGIESLNEIIAILKKGVEDSKYLDKFFKIIYDHKINCKFNDFDECACSLFEIDNLLHESKLKYQYNLNTNEKAHKFQKSYRDLIILTKNEIEKTLCIINIKSSSSSSLRSNLLLEQYLLIHIDFILYFRKKSQLCLYFKNRYTLLGIKSFKFNFYLFLIEKEILRIENENDFTRNKIEGKNIKDYSKYNFNLNLKIQFLDVYFYLKQLSQIKALLVKNIENFHNIIKFKNLYNNLILKANTQDSCNYSSSSSNIFTLQSLNTPINTEDILYSCIDINKDYELLLMIITKEYNESNFVLKNVELCFLLFNFYFLIDKHIPLEIESNFIYIKDYQSLLRFETSFEEKGVRHPMIAKLIYKNFVITYISQKLCDYLGYKKQELLGEDFHKLLPTCFNEQHSLMIKKYLLYDNNHYFKKETFVLAKSGYYFRVKVNLINLPGLENNTYIADMQPDIYDKSGNDPNEKLNQSPENNFLVLVLDRKYDIITINQKFEEKFNLSLEMMHTMEKDISIFDMFALPENQIKSDFNQNLKKIQNQNEHWNNLVEIFNCSDVKLLLKDDEKNREIQKKIEQILPELPGSPYKKNKSIQMQANNYISKSNPHKFSGNFLNSKTFYRRKMVMTSFLQKLQSVVLENEYPKEWYNKITEIEKAINRSISPTIRLNFIKEMTYELKNAPNDLLIIEIQLRCIANLPYYLIKIWDNENDGRERDSPFFKNPSKTTDRNIFKKILLKKKVNKQSDSNLQQYNLVLEEQEESQDESLINENSKDSYLICSKDKFKELNKSMERSTVVDLKEANSKNLPITDRSKISHMSKTIKNRDNNVSLIKKISNKILNIIPIVRYSGKLKTSPLDVNSVQSVKFQNLNESKDKDDSKMNFLSKDTSLHKISNQNSISNNHNVNNDSTNFHGIYSMNGSKDSTNVNSQLENTYSPHKRYKRRMEIQKQHKKISKSLINFLFLVVSLIVLTTLSVYNIYFSSSRLLSSQKLFRINYNAMGLKGIIVFSGAGVISNCIKAGGLDTASIDGYTITMENYQKKMKMRAQEMYVYVYALKSYLQESGEILGMREIYDIMTKIDVYYLMSENWQTYTRNSTFVDELDYFHYYVANLQNSGLWSNCQIKSQGQVSGGKYGGENEPASFGEKVTYYTIHNMITKFRNNLLNLTTVSSKLLEKFHNSSKYELVIFNLVILCVFVTLGITIFMSILNYRKKISSVLKKLFEIKNEDEIFEKKLLNFKSVLICLDKNSCIEYEINKGKISKDEDDLNQIKQKPHTYIGIEFKLDKKEKEFQILKDKERNLLNENCKENFEDYFYISFVKTSLYVIFVFNLLYIILILVNIITNIGDYNTILFSNRVAINFLDRVPRLMDLILYYKISIVQNEPNFIIRPRSEYSSRSDFYNLFNIQNNLDDDTIFSSLSESEFSFILYMLQLERSNIQTFYDEKYSNFLPTTRMIETKFNTKDACLTLGEYTFYYTPNRDPLISIDFRYWFTLMSNYTQECRSINKGMNLNGFSLALDNHISSMVTLYIDYYRSEKDKKTTSSNINSTDFLKEPNFLRAQINAEGSLKRYHNAILTTLKIDMESLYNQTIQKEYIFSSVKVIIAFTFIVYFIFLVLMKLQNYSYHLKIGINKFTNAIG